MQRAMGWGEGAGSKEGSRGEDSPLAPSSEAKGGKVGEELLGRIGHAGRRGIAGDAGPGLGEQTHLKKRAEVDDELDLCLLITSTTWRPSTNLRQGEGDCEGNRVFPILQC